MADGHYQGPRFDPNNCADAVARIKRIADDLVALARIGIQPSVNINDDPGDKPFYFITAFGFGPSGNISGNGFTVDDAVKELRGRTFVELNLVEAAA